MYIEQPTENRTLCKIVSQEYSVIYVGDQLKHSIEIKMKYFAIEDYVQESGKKFKMLIESQHSKRAKSTDFLYIYFEHYKLAPLQHHKPKDKLQVYLDTLKINYNPDTILALMNFASSVTVTPSSSPEPEPSTTAEPAEQASPKTPSTASSVEKKKKPRTPDKSVTLRLSFDFRQLYINLNKPI